MTNPKRCLPGFVKCLKFALEYNFKLICMSSKSLYDLLPAYVPSFNFYHSLLNFALHQSWVCFSRYGAFMDLYPLLAWNTHQANPEALWTLPPHFQGGPRWCHHHVWVITLGHLLNDVDLFLCPSPIAIWESLDWARLIAVPLVYLQCLHIAGT